MPTVKRSVIVPYTPEQMFDLVSDVARYPEFMPWCGGADVMEQDESGMTASIMIKIARISQNFTTKNTHDYPNRIQLELVDGPRSEEHTSELQSRGHLVCRLLLEKKKKNRSKP